MRIAQNMLGSVRALLLLTPAALMLWCVPVSAQFFFGKNKVQYTEFNWQVMETEHFRLYFYTEESEIAQIAARVAEDAYRTLRTRFNQEVHHKIPLIIYSSSSYFAETNVVPGLLPESVAGFTEFLKGRVVIPFHGSYHDFVHVIRHELVHVFQISRLSTVTAHQGNVQFGFPPLWFTEGLAEFWSKQWDTQADMIVKDMVINDRLLGIEDLWRIRGSFFMYKLGESICQFIDSTYGPDKIARIYDNWTRGRKFADVVALTLGDDLKTVSRKWRYALKKKYYPEIGELGLPKMEAQQLTSRGFNMKAVPLTWDDGKGTKDWIVFMANRMGYTGIYLKPRRASKSDLRTLVKGERSAAFESLHLLRSGIDADSSGRIVFSAKSKQRDVINIYDLNRGKVTERFSHDEIVGMRSPRFSHDGRRVVFTGIRKNGYADIYMLTLATGVFTPLTNDLYYDIDPTFDLRDGSVYFASDRCEGGPEGALNLFRADLSSGAIEQVTFGPYRDVTPEITAAGIYFGSNRLGSFNLFLLDNDGTLTRQSTYVTGAFDPRITPDGGHLVFSGYQDMSYQVYEMKLPEKPRVMAEVTPERAAPTWYPKRIDTSYVRTTMKYDTDYSFDFAQSAVGYDPVFGTIGGFQASMSDILGNHAYYFLLTNTADTKDEFLTSFNFGVTYINRGHRLNWGVGAYHLFNDFFNDRDQFFTERQAGVLGILSYPVSRFARFDFATFARYDKKDRRFGLIDREGFITTFQLSWVYDNSLWDITGPIEGRRYNLSAAITYDLNGFRNYNRTVWADIRHYFRLGTYSAFAHRAFAYHSTGLEPRQIYWGGSWNFRGFDRRQWYSRNILFTSQELRFPLIDALLIGLPIGGLGFRGIRGALFFDTGSAWNDHFDQFYGSFGAGARVTLARLIVLRFDFSRTTDFKTISPKTDFDFFFGWNF